MDFKKKLKIISALILSLSIVGSSFSLHAASSYEKILKKWTRHENVYVVENFEARVIWRVTEFSPEFREARLEKLTKLYEWDDAELSRQRREDSEEAAKYDVFFMGIYAGSSEYPEIGKDSGKWRFLLEVPGSKTIEAVSIERVSVTQKERVLFPYLDKWSEAYLIRFPKTIHENSHFALRMAGIPAKSELVWK